MADAKAAAKKKYGDLFGGAKDGGDEPDDGGEPDGDEAADDGEDDGGYDLKTCANDIMAAVKAGDVDALEEALSELVNKVKG